MVNTDDENATMEEEREFKIVKDPVLYYGC